MMISSWCPSSPKRNWIYLLVDAPIDILVFLDICIYSTDDEIPIPQGQREIQRLQNSAQCASQLIQKIDDHLEDIADAVNAAELVTQAS